MQGNILLGDWTKVRARMQKHWGKLTPADLDKIAGQRDKLIGALELRYGTEAHEAESQIRGFEASMGGTHR